MMKAQIQKASDEKTDKSGNTQVQVAPSSEAISHTPLWIQGGFTQRQSLQISSPGDAYEQEADAIASQVMRQPASHVQRRCSCGGIAGADGECAACKAKRLQRETANSSASSSVASESEAPASVHQTLAQPGQALGTATRHFMESRFGQDFSHVRVHTDSQAAQSAADVNARAYTVGNNVVFGAGQYQPQTPLGLHLLAHELVHTVQQLETRTGILQRVCGAREISPRSQGCIGRGGDIDTYGGSSENLYLFEANCDDFIAGEEQRLRDFALSIGSHDTVTIDGFASEEGAADFNEELSCARANHAARVLVDAGVTPGQIIGIYNHGATRGDRPSHRSVVIDVQSPQQSPQPEVTAPAAQEYVACYDGSRVYVHKNGRSHNCLAVTSSNAPTPDGEFCIRHQGAAQLGWRPWRDHSDWFLLEPQFTTQRFRMHLHPGSVSAGCVTVTDDSCFGTIASILNEPGEVSRPGYDGYPPGNSAGVDNEQSMKSCVGILLVRRSRGGCSFMPQSLERAEIRDAGVPLPAGVPDQDAGVQ